TVPAVLSLSATCSRSVLLPIPGSPPISTSVPATIPPPSTRSNSVTSDGVRTSSCDSISAYVTASTSRSLNPLRDELLRVSARSSMSEFHSPHSGHLPNHFGLWCPQF